MSEMYQTYPDRIARFFEDKTVLITGATGFVGKVLLEKMLRACGGVKKVYVLIRSKREKEPQIRLVELFRDPIFGVLKTQHDASIFQKVEAISGDVSLPGLDLSLSDRQKLCSEVEIIFHCAAIVRFDIPLQEAVIVNVRGTKLMLELAKECQNLLNFVHVSTAYCHLDEDIVKEQIYPPPRNPHDVIKICECLENELVETIKNKILEKFPNCYPFTKALSEGLVSDEMERLPVVIFRPSVVVPIWREPLPGYTDNINGPTGLLIGGGKGVIRTLFCRGDGYLDYIPADLVANGLLFSTFDFVTNKGQRRVYNAVSSHAYKLTFNQVVKMGKTIVETALPFNNIFWYPGGSLTQSKIKHYTIMTLFQILPALIIDTILILCRIKPFFMKIQKRTLNAYALCEYYVNRNWDFDNSKSMEAIELLNPREREIYKMDGRGGNFRDYFLNCIHSARLYLLKESDDQIPAAKMQMKVMWFVDWLCKIFVVSALFYYISSKLFS
ncbi:hypothetical protein Zmor_017126 [Zophobas morio]|uniref:Fatty acyl-CoA reductase n=1 Tax=Zophobas morio TaxID=2755281 RepID=A0AA38MBP2_9CUCU|nr:hypothetical protein Zmor_017126 [Zophobas morio]